VSHHLWFYADDATRLKGRVVSYFDWNGEPHVVLEHRGPSGLALVVRSEYVTSPRPDAIGFGDVNDDANADVAAILNP
jgi:hypothetical protein